MNFVLHAKNNYASYCSCFNRSTWWRERGGEGETVNTLDTSFFREELAFMETNQQIAEIGFDADAKPFMQQ